MISQTRNYALALLLAAVTASATSMPAVSDTAPPKDYAKICAPPHENASDQSPANQTPASTGSNAGAQAKSAKGKSNTKDSDDDDDDAKDFPPLKPGESFHLIGFSLSGSKHVDEDALIATLPEHQGDTIHDAQVKADTAKIKAALTAQHVHFVEVTTGLVQREGPDHCVWVVWDIQHVDAFSRLPYQGYWKFGGQTFSGNKSLTNEQLETAIDLKLGERVREGTISDAITGMQQAYDKVFPGKTVKIDGKLKLTQKPERVAEFEWEIVEPPPK